MAAQCCVIRMFAFECGYLSLMHSFSIISENITSDHVLPESTILSATFLSPTVWVNFNPISRPKLLISVRWCKITAIIRCSLSFEDHRFWYQSIRKPVCTLVGLTYCTSYVVQFPWHRRVLVEFSLSTGAASVYAFVRDEPLNSGSYNLVPRN